MRLYRGKVEVIAEDTIRALREQGMIELENEAEARIDIEAVLKEYLRLDREIVDDAKNRMEVRGLGYSQLGKVKSQVSKERGAPGQDEVLPYLLDQIMNILFHSANVAEIFAEDVELRKTLTPILRSTWKSTPISIGKCVRRSRTCRKARPTSTSSTRA